MVVAAEIRGEALSLPFYIGYPQKSLTGLPYREHHCGNFPRGKPKTFFWAWLPPTRQPPGMQRLQS